MNAGDASPRRIACVAFCGAGSVITLAAAWAAVQWPTADVRCITFGSQLVGNAAFAESFRYVNLLIALVTGSGYYISYAVA